MHNTKAVDRPLAARTLTFAPASPMCGADLRDRATRRLLAGLSSGIVSSISVVSRCAWKAVNRFMTTRARRARDARRIRISIRDQFCFFGTRTFRAALPRPCGSRLHPAHAHPNPGHSPPPGRTRSAGNRPDGHRQNGGLRPADPATARQAAAPDRRALGARARPGADPRAVDPDRPELRHLWAAPGLAPHGH